MFQNYLFYFAKRHAKTSFLTLPAPKKTWHLVNFFWATLEFCFLGFYWRFAFWHSASNSLFKEFFATLKLRIRRTSGFALRATPPFAKIFDFVQNGSSWRVKSALLKFLAAHFLSFAFETLKRFQPLRQSFALAGFASLHPTEFSLLKNS